jgi:hypothetical protein
VDGAQLCDELLAELESAVRSRDDELLTLPAAASVSGYTVDHLARLIRQGKLPNAGRKHAPRICRRDVPPKSRDGASVRTRHRYNTDTDARSLMHRLQHGGVHGSE